MKTGQVFTGFGKTKKGSHHHAAHLALKECFGRFVELPAGAGLGDDESQEIGTAESSSMEFDTSGSLPSAAEMASKNFVVMVNQRHPGLQLGIDNILSF